LVFSNLVFLFVFLPILLVTYFFAFKKLQNMVLLVFSLVFYAWGEPKYVFLMIFSIILNYVFGLIIYRVRENVSKKKLYLFMAIALNLLLLGYYKYINFLIANINSFLDLNIQYETVILPIGISFYTFQAMSYVIDVYRSEDKVQKNPFDLALYVTLFPQLIAGPIVRYSEVMDQLKSRIVTFAKFSEGIRIFIIGLAKKVLIANQVGFIADEIFSKNPSEISVTLAWIGIIAYSLQIYFDFSGYSQMAIGLGKLFGFDFPINFNYPYISKSISEFWRRWHITLGSWFRDYVYIPLGGNRVSKWTNYRNLFIVWGLTGLWHGASWTFIAWGLYYGLIIIIEKSGWESILRRLWAPLQHAYVILIFMVGWVFFRADDFSFSLNYIGTMFGLDGTRLHEPLTMFYLHNYGLVLLIAIIVSMPIVPWIQSKLALSHNTLSQALNQFLIPVAYLGLFILCIVHLTNSTFNPFIYFRF
jgi:alginate O-acetyltransferase complex protein AlgI